MVTVHDSLLALTARDLMSPGLIRIPQEMSLRAAAERLAAAGLHGAPVVDGDGRCVGVLSTTDFLRLNTKPMPRPANNALDSYFAPWKMLDPNELPADSVAKHMTRPVHFVRPVASLGVLARMMVEHHVHRLIVAEDGDRPIGVVSATNVLEAVAKFSETETPSAF
jgi:CBS domain-containing protein